MLKLVATDGDMEWVVTDQLAALLSRVMVLEAEQVRWQAGVSSQDGKPFKGVRKKRQPP